MVSRILDCASKISDYFGDEEVTWDDVLVEERCLLMSTMLSASAPTLLCWVSTFLCRFHEVVHGSSEGLSDSASYLGEWCAAVIVREVPYSAEAPPLRIALGICGAVLAALGLIPTHDLRPAEMSAADWNATLAAMVGVGAGGVAAAQPAPHALRMLEIATQHGAFALKAAAREVVGMLRGLRIPEDSEL